MDDELKFKIAHIKLPSFSFPSETFVFSRISQSICIRPVPVLTEVVTADVAKNNYFLFFEINKLGPIHRRIELGFQLLFHWSPFFLYCLSQINPDLIYAHFSYSAEPCLLSAKLLKIPILVSFYGVETKKFIHDPKMLPRIQNIYKWADKITCLSQSMFDDILATGCPAEKLVLIRLGVDTDLFFGEPLLWASGQTLHLISIARLHPEKGLTYLLQACELLDASGFNNWQLKIIGNGELESELRNQCQEAGIAKKVIFLGNKTPTDVSNLLRSSHILILPSIQETQGVVLQEAQSTGTPVIASKVGGIPEGIIDRETGFLVDPKSPNGIFSAIMTFVNNPDLLIKMGKAGREFVVAKFSKSIEERQLGELYDELTTKNSKVAKQKI